MRQRASKRKPPEQALACFPSTHSFIIGKEWLTRFEKRLTVLLAGPTDRSCKRTVPFLRVQESSRPDRQGWAIWGVARSIVVTDGCNQRDQQSRTPSLVCPRPSQSWNLRPLVCGVWAPPSLHDGRTLYEVNGRQWHVLNGRSERKIRLRHFSTQVLGYRVGGYLTRRSALFGLRKRPPR
jgi:hypothetical protein